MKNNLWEAADLFIGKINEEELLVLSLSTALIQKSDNSKIERLLQSSSFSTEKYVDVLIESASETNLTLPTTVEEIKRIIEKIKLQGLNDFLFMMIKLFRRTSPHLEYDR